MSVFYILSEHSISNKEYPMIKEGSRSALLFSFLNTSSPRIDWWIFNRSYFIFYCSPKNQSQPAAGTSLKATAHLDIGNSVLDIGYSNFTEMLSGLNAGFSDRLLGLIMNA
jgi:hypothetical protein